MKVTKYEERDDGSALMQVEMTKTEQQILIEKALLDTIIEFAKETIEREKILKELEELNSELEEEDYADTSSDENT